MTDTHFDIEQLGTIESVKQCDGVHELVTRSVEQAPDATHLFSTFRHPGVTTSTRLVVGDIVGNIAANQMKARDGDSIHSNLIWEANILGTKNATVFNFRLLNALGHESLSVHLPYVSIPWFQRSPAYITDAFRNVVEDEQQFSEIAGRFAHIFGIPIGTSQERVTHLRDQYSRHFVNNTLQLPLTVASQQLYDELLGDTLGEEFASQSPQVPYIEVAKNIVLPQLRNLGEEAFQEIVRKRYPNGIKTLFYGYPQVEGDDIVGYVGWSPQGKFVIAHDRVSDGKGRGKAKDITLERVFELVEAGQMAPIGITPMIVLYPDPTFLLHGADHGSREVMNQFVDCQSGALQEPHHSWAMLKVDMGDGNLAEPSLQELYILFGYRSPVLRNILLQSLHRAEPVVIHIDKFKELVHAAQ
jgi:hypothetical protein